jgi:uncharacterized protein YjiS (DUF1127 family)
MTTLTFDYAGYSETVGRDGTKSLLELATLWYQRARQRRQLAQLSDAQLDDIGVNRAEARAEAAKPFWCA